MAREPRSEVRMWFLGEREVDVSFASEDGHDRS